MFRWIGQLNHVRVSEYDQGISLLSMLCFLVGALRVLAQNYWFSYRWPFLGVGTETRCPRQRAKISALSRIFKRVVFLCSLLLLKLHLLKERLSVIVLNLPRYALGAIPVVLLCTTLKIGICDRIWNNGFDERVAYVVWETNFSLRAKAGWSVTQRSFNGVAVAEHRSDYLI